MTKINVLTFAVNPQEGASWGAGTIIRDAKSSRPCKRTGI